MKNNITSNITSPEDANPAKKQWQKPDFYIVDRNDNVQGGSNFLYLEGQQDPGKTPGNVLGPASQYYS